MAPQQANYVRFGIVIAIIVVSLGYLAYTGVKESESYYSTIAELHRDLKTNEDAVYRRHLNVSGIVQPGTIHQVGTNADFIIFEQDPNTREVQTLRVSYQGTEPPPDTFKDGSQALVLGQYGKDGKDDGVFHAKEIQAKCASKYAPQQGTAAASGPASAKGN